MRLRRSTLEFMIIFVCLIKRIKNVQRFAAFSMEAKDNYLRFDDADYDFLNRLKKPLKSNCASPIFNSTGNMIF